MKRTDDTTSRTGSGRHIEPRESLRLVRPGDAVETPATIRDDERRAGRSVSGPAEGRPRPAHEREHQHTPRVRAGREREDELGNREWEARAETAAAAGLAAHDARWVTAARASQAIEGGRAAVLRPEVRARLVSSAERMGLRPFDANLVLAIVQDAARQGQTIQDPDTADRLALVRGREPTRRRWGFFAALCLALSAMWALLLIWWLRG